MTLFGPPPKDSSRDRATYARAVARSRHAQNPAGSTYGHIPPGETRTVINVAFSSEQPGKYQGYVHIKTDADA